MAVWNNNKLYWIKMPFSYVYLIFLGLIYEIKSKFLFYNSQKKLNKILWVFLFSKWRLTLASLFLGELSLQVIKNVEAFYTPISFLVEEKVGANFSLLCELVSSEKDNNNIDSYISWGKESSTLR